MSIMKRLNHIDAMRAFSMFLIVYSHLVHYGLQQNISLFNRWTETFFVPLFFFISGFVSYKVKDSISWSSFLKKNGSRFRVLVLSPLVFLAGFCLYRQQDYWSALGDPLKNGYWFTIVLFQISMLVSIVFWVGNRCNDCLLAILSIILMMGGVFVISKYNSISDHPNFTDYGSWMYVTYYYVFYIIGLFVHKYERLVLGAINKRLVCCIVFIMAFVPLSKNSAVNYLPITARVLAVYYVFNALQGFFENGGVIVRSILYAGRHTLEIYFIHYFLLFRCNELVPVFNGRPLIEFLVFSLLSVLIMAVCVLLRKILGTFKPVSSILFGKG